MNNENRRSVLHVEINNDIDDTDGGLPLSGEDGGTDSYVGLSDREDIDKDATEEDAIVENEMDGVIMHYTDKQHEEFEMNENLEHGFKDIELRPEVKAVKPEAEAARQGVEATTLVNQGWMMV